MTEDLVAAYLEEDDVDSSDDGPGYQEQHHPTGLEFVTLADLRARVAAAGPRRWLLRGVWPAGDYGVHAAEQKAQKTWNTVDLAVSVASGTRWLGHIAVDDPGPVIMFFGEGGEGNAVRRIEAVCETRGLDPDSLPIVVCSRAPHLNDVVHLSLLRAEVERLRPRLVTLDPLYLAARGADLGDLYKMGALLETPQRICQTNGASLFVVTHFNRKSGSGAARITGAGPAEWGRVLMSATVKARHTEPDTKASRVLTELDIIGGEIPDQTFRINRRVWSDDPDDLDSPLHLDITIDTEEPDDGPRAPELGPAAGKLLEALQAADCPRTGTQLVDFVAKRHGHGLTRETTSRNLNELEKRDLAYSVPQGQFQPKLWGLVAPRDSRDVTRDDHTEPSRVTGVTAPIGGHASRGHTSHDDSALGQDHATSLTTCPRCQAQSIPTGNADRGGICADCASKIAKGRTA